MQRARLRAILREKELWILVLLGILYFYRLLFLGKTFFYRDLYAYFLPQKRLLVDFIASRELPLWDPYLHGGQAYLVNIANFALYPSNLLYLFLPLFRAFNVNIVLHLIFCSASAYLFSRVVGLKPASSLIVGGVYGYCGYTLSLINLLNLFLALLYIPLLCLFWHLFLLEGKRKWFVITVIIGVVQVLPGAPEANVISLLSLLGWTLFYPYPHTSFLRMVVRWLLLGIFIIGIASVVLLPAMEMALQSSRWHGLSYGIFSSWSLYPERLPEMFFPGFFGYHTETLLPEIYYWGGKVMDEHAPTIPSIYFGFVAVVLAFFGGLHKDNDRVFPFRVRLFLFLLFVFSLLLSLGRFLPFFRFLFQYLPLITLFRFPIKILIAGLLPLALLAGYASEVHFGGVKIEDREIRKKNLFLEPRTSNSDPSEYFPSLTMLVVLWVISAIFISFTIAFWYSSDFANHFQEVFFKQSGGEVAHRGLGFSFAHASAIWLLVTLLYQYRRLKRRHWQHWILVCIIMLDLLSAGKRVNPYASEKFFKNTPAVVQIVRDEIGDGRLFRAASPSKAVLQAPSNDIVWWYRWRLEVLDSDLAAFYRIPVIFHGDLVKLAPVRIMKLKALIELLPWERRLPLLSAGGVTLILTSDNISIPGIRRIAEIPNRSNVPFYLYRNETAAARVEFVTSWRFFTSDTEALGAMLTPTYDPRKHVALQKPETTLFDLHAKTLKLPMADSNFSECDGPLQIKKMSSNTHLALFSVSNSCDGYLVFSEPFYPGWQVYVDGNPTPVLRANYAFSAVFLPAGEHEVKRCYRPNSLLAGALSSAVFCCVLLFITYKGWFLRVD